MKCPTWLDKSWAQGVGFDWHSLQDAISVEMKQTHLVPVT